MFWTNPSAQPNNFFKYDFLLNLPGYSLKEVKGKSKILDLNT